MRDFLSALVTAIAILLILPTGLILASWNAIPGDSLYGLKRGLENVAFVLTKDTPIATAFSLKFTDRRFAEANILLAQKSSTVGYTLLVAEAQKTKDIIVEKKDTQSASELVAKIDQYQATIQQKRTALETTTVPGTPQVVPTPGATPTFVSTSRPQPTQPAPTNPPVATTPPIVAEPPPTVINNLQQTNDQLEKIKQDLEKEVHENKGQEQPKPEKGNKD